MIIARDKGLICFSGLNIICMLCFVVVELVDGRTLLRKTQSSSPYPVPDRLYHNTIPPTVDRHSINSSLGLSPETDVYASGYHPNHTRVISRLQPEMTQIFRPMIRVFTMDSRCRMFEFVVSFVLLGVTCLFGFVGNVLSILTLRRDPVKSVTTFLLSALAVADTVFLVPVIFVILIPTACEFYQNCPERLDNVIPVFEQFGWGLTGTCHTCTVYVTVLVAVHRYLWVCRLQSVERLSGLRRAKMQVACVPLFALLYNSPRFFEYRVIHYSWNDTLSSDVNTIRRETTKILAKVGRNHLFQIGYKNVLFIIFMYIIPLTILVLVSINLIKTLKTRRDTLRRIGSSSSTTSASRRDDNVTLVLIVIIAAFIVCQTPIMIQRLMLAVSGSSGPLGCGTFYFFFEHIAYYMVLLNSSTNFVIYILFSPHFRQTLAADVLHRRRASGGAAVQLSGSRTRKVATNGGESMALIQTMPDAKPTLVITGVNRELTENSASSGYHNSKPSGTHGMLPVLPDITDGFRSTLQSNYSQSTNQDILMTSVDDFQNPEAEMNDKRSVVPLRNVDVLHKNEEEESATVK